MRSVNNITNILDKLKSIDYIRYSRYRAFDEVLSLVETLQEFKELLKAILKVCSVNKNASYFFNCQTQTKKIAKKFELFIKDCSPEDIICILEYVSEINNPTQPGTHRLPFNAFCDSFAKNIYLFNGDKKKLIENITKKLKYLPEELKYILSKLLEELKIYARTRVDSVTRKVNNQENEDTWADLKELCSAEDKESSNNASSVTTEVNNQENEDTLVHILADLKELCSAEDKESSNNASSVTTEVNNQEKKDDLARILTYLKEPLSAERIELSNNAKPLKRKLSTSDVKCECSNNKVAKKDAVTTEVNNQEDAVNKEYSMEFLNEEYNMPEWVERFINLSNNKSSNLNQQSNYPIEHSAKSSDDIETFDIQNESLDLDCKLQDYLTGNNKECVGRVIMTKL